MKGGKMRFDHWREHGLEADITRKSWRYDNTKCEWEGYVQAVTQKQTQQW